MSRNYDYKTGKVLLYHQNYYKLIHICLSRQINMTISRQIHFKEKLDDYYGAKKLCIAVK